MSSDFSVMAVTQFELLARFILHSNCIHKSDNTLTQNAFIPPKDLKLSVTRHIGLSERDMWNCGKDVASLRKLQLYGRADIITLFILNQSLIVDAAPITTNKNHANIIGWPSDKERRKIIALELAREAAYFPNPETINEQTV